MAHTRSSALAKGKTKVYRPPTRTSPKLASLRSQGTVQPQFQAPVAPVENIATSILPPKKCITYQMAGEGTSRVGTKSPCRRSSESQRCIVPRTKRAEEALPAAEDGVEETLPKNDVYAALWAMLDAESENEAEGIPGKWDLDSILNNWGKIELDVGPSGSDQGPPPVAN
ncbi:hypothetical protein PIB30_073261 [Stylosanthes scabra]|uniref:Uncharacterized protein n=1 Tax=Stylosanthes scabra TaxID=79078 RepID=A0ABU6RPV3_9FABA|nr:hypothetical protein [Stylosanthes scabra]